MSQGRLWRYPNGSYKAVAELELVCIPVLQGRDVALGCLYQPMSKKRLSCQGPSDSGLFHTFILFSSPPSRSSLASGELGSRDRALQLYPQWSCPSLHQAREMCDRISHISWKVNALHDIIHQVFSSPATETFILIRAGLNFKRKTP